MVIATPTDDQGSDEDDSDALNNDDYDDQGMLYEEGVWVAANKAREAIHDDNVTHELQQTCYVLLMERHTILRQQLVMAVPPATRVFESMEMKLNLEPYPVTKRDWFQSLDNFCPTPHQLRKMNEQRLFLGLQCVSKSLAQSTTISHTKCCWLWGLLASVGDFGTLDPGLISQLRELGVAAAELGQRLRRSSAYQEYQEYQEASGDNDHGIEEVPSRNDDVHENEPNTEVSEFDHGLDEKGPTGIEQARAGLLAQLGDRLVAPIVHSSRAEAERSREQGRQHAGADEHRYYNMVASRSGTEKTALSDSIWNTTLAIDMVLTVVGERYGQRDLLECRRTW